MATADKRGVEPKHNTFPGQSGIGLIEVLVAAVVLALGILATLVVFDAGGHSTLASQRTEQAASVGQREIERLTATPYQDLAMSSVPTHSDDGLAPDDPMPDDPAKPDFYVTTSGAGCTQGCLQIKSSWASSGSETLATEPFVSSADGAVAPGPDTVTSGNTSASVYRFVTVHTESCDSCDAGAPGSLLAKRITVAVVTNAPSGPTQRPVWLTTLVTPPDTGDGPSNG